MNILSKSLWVLLMSGVAGAAAAQGYYEPAARGLDDSGVGYDFARVVDVQPVYDEVPISTPRRVCWNEPVTYTSAPRYTRYRPRDEAPEIVGGIIGGLIGNQFGHGDGRAAATLAGFALGSAVARDAERRDRYEYGYAPRYERAVSERRCEVREDYQRERQLVGYDVTYDYNGTVGRTFTERQPGTEIRVRVAVEAADE